MISPGFLQQGDRIQIVSPAGKVNKDKILSGTDLLEEQGFEVLFGDHVFTNHFQFAGTDEERLRDLQQALDDPKCKAIICARGGYGSIRIADQINFTQFKKNPKWLVGFSDITVLHSLFQKEGFCSIHGAMPGFYLDEGQPSESFLSLMKILKGEKLEIECPTEKLNRKGVSEAPIIGGNLSILYSLLGTSIEPDTNDKILFIEDLSEYLYHLDRIMHSLKLSGKLAHLKGLVVGQFTDMKDNDSPFGQSVEEIILNAVKEYDFPVCFNFPVGHVDQNLPLMVGAKYQLDVSDNSAQLKLL